MDLAGVIVCGGGSRRMGTDKARLEIDGEDLLRRAARRLAEVAQPVVIAPGQRGRYGALPWPEVDDVVPAAGPGSGLIAALAVSPHARMAAVAVDLPNASPDLLVELGASWAGEVAVVPVAAGRDQWLHAVWSAAAHDTLRERLIDGARSFVALTDGLPVRRVAAPGERFALNLNRPEDLARLRDAGEA